MTAASLTDRTAFSVQDTIKYIWKTVDLPESTLTALHLSGDGPGLPSSFKVGHIAQASIALTALAAALIRELRNGAPASRVEVPLDHACLEFKSVDLWTIDGQPASPDKHPIGGVHKTLDGYVIVLDGFSHHRSRALEILGLPYDVTAEQVRQAMRHARAEELEAAAFRMGAVIGALRSFEAWDALPQSAAVSDFPVSITKVAESESGLELGKCAKESLSRLKVLDFSRIIAAPVAGKILAAHGADVLWVTSPNLPERPEFDRDTARGKRSIHIDLDCAEDVQTLQDLLKSADVIIQSYRPGALAEKGLGLEDVIRNSRKGIVYASLSAFGSEGPWSGHRGFDSFVQTVSGMNFAEAQAWGDGATRSLPTQVLDYASGFFLAFGIMSGIYKRAVDGGSYLVEGSLAQAGKYLRSLGQYEGRSGFTGSNIKLQKDVPEHFLETKVSGLGLLRALKHSAKIDGEEIGWDRMPTPLGSDRAVWLN